MQQFEANPVVLTSKESKRIVRTYNNVARTLVAFEYLWYDAWCRALEAARAGLSATLIIRHPSTRKMYVNFDRDIYKLLREAKCLSRIGVQIPDIAESVLLQENKFKRYFDEIKFMLSEYERVTDKILPVTSKLMQPHLRDLEIYMQPGMVTLTWTSMNIDVFKHTIHRKLKLFEGLIQNVNDIIENRIQKVLRSMIFYVVGRSFFLMRCKYV